MITPRRPAPLIETFNTHLMDDATVRALQTARGRETDEVMGAIRRNCDIAPGRLQHVVIYGPRGFGKSFMTRWIQIQIAELVAADRPIFYILLPEEQHNLTRSPHALLDYLAAKLSDQRTGENRSWTESAFHWPNPAREAALWDEAMRTLEAEINTTLDGRNGLVIAVVENFDTLLATLFKHDIDEQRLRKWLGRAGNRLMLLATGTRTADIDYERPLFQAFQSVPLAPWVPDDCISYFNQRRKLEGRDPLDGRTEAKARAIADFIGGNPRLAQLLGEVLDTEDALTVVGTMNALADRLADYYRRRIDDLPPLARGLVDALIRGGEPCSATELAGRVGADQSDIARVMQDLRHADIIRGVPAPGSKETKFRVIDRVFVHFYRLRQGEALARTSPLLTILEFLQSFYSRDEQRTQAARYLALGRPDEASVFSRLAMESEPPGSVNWYLSNFEARLGLYLAAAPDAIALGVNEIVEKLEGAQPADLYASCVAREDGTILDKAIQDALRAQILCRMRLLDDAEKLLRLSLKVVEGAPEATIVASGELGYFLRGERRKIAEAMPMWEISSDQLNSLKSQHFILLAYDTRSWLFSLDSHTAERGIACAEEALALARRLGVKRWQAIVIKHKARSLAALGRHNEAIVACDEAASLAAETGGKREEAAAILRKAQSLNELGCYKEAITAANKAATLAAEAHAKHDQSAAIRCKMLSFRALGRNEEVIVAADEAVILACEAHDRHGQAEAISLKAVTLHDLGRYREALLVADRAAVLASEAGYKLAQAAIANLKSASHMLLSEFKDAIAIADEAVAFAVAAGSQRDVAQAHLLASRNLGHLGNTTDAWTRAVAAYEAACKSDDDRQVALSVQWAIEIANKTPGPLCVTMFDRWLYLHSRHAKRVVDPRLWFDSFVVAVMRAEVWFEFDQLIRRWDSLIFRNSRDQLLTRAIGHYIAEISKEEGRAKAFSAAREVLPRLSRMFNKNPNTGRVDDWLGGIVDQLTKDCRDTGLLRDIAELIDDTMAPDAPHFRSLLLGIADFDEGPGGAAGLARVDPDVAIWIRRIRDIPDEAPSPPARAKPRIKPAQR